MARSPASSRARSRVGEAADGGGADRGDRRGVDDRHEAPVLGLEEEDRSLVRVEGRALVAGEERDGLEPQDPFGEERARHEAERTDPLGQPEDRTAAAGSSPRARALRAWTP
jgi:hypothetical protein